MTEDIPTTDTPAASPIKSKAPSNKSVTVIKLLTRAKGATLTDISKETGWQPHTVRAFLSGLRKKGTAITKGKRDEVTCYHAKAAN